MSDQPTIPALAMPPLMSAERARDIGRLYQALAEQFEAGGGNAQAARGAAESPMVADLIDQLRVDFGPSALGTLAFSLTMVMAAESSLIEAASIPSGDLLDLIRGRPLDVD